MIYLFHIGYFSTGVSRLYTHISVGSCSFEWHWHFFLCINVFTRLWCFVFQHDLPIRYESDVKLGDTQCNIILSRLKPWMRLRSSKGKKMVLQDGSSNPGRLHSTESKGIIWSCKVSAPEMTAMLYSLSGSPLYLVCDFFKFFLGVCVLVSLTSQLYMQNI